MTTEIQSSAPTYYRFRLLQGKVNVQGQLENTKKVGIAYLREGESVYSLKLWTFVKDRFFLEPSKNHPARWIVITKEKNRYTDSPIKSFINIVGSANIDAVQGYLTIKFDLFSDPIYMSFFPDENARSMHFPSPEQVNDVA